MPFWKGRADGSGGDPNAAAERQRRQEASIEALESGSLPLEATARLARTGNSPWTSTLSVPDFLASRQLGLQPLGQVMGSCVMQPAFNANWLYGSWGNGDIPALTRAITLARDTAIDRLRQEAELLGAHGVVAVHVAETRPEWGSGLVEFTAMGTAVVLRNQPAPKTLFMGNVSATDTWALLEAGYLPMNVVFATTAYYVMTTWDAVYAESSWSNQEIPDFSRAIYGARDYVVSGMRAQARDVKADGVLGAEWTMRVEDIEVQRPGVDRWGGYGVGDFRDHIIYMTVLGTAIGLLPHLPGKPSVLPILSMKDRVSTTLPGGKS